MNMIIRNKAALPLLISALFSVLYTFVPWEKISKKGVFEDREVYLNKLNYLLAVLDEKHVVGLLDYFTNEVLWDVGIRAVAQSFSVDISSIFWCITFFCLFLFSYLLCRKFGWPSLVLLLNPLVVDFAFSQLRSAFAASILILAWMSWRRRSGKIAVALLVPSIFIHSISILIIVVALTLLAIEKLYSNKSFEFHASIGFILGLFGVLMLGPLRGDVLNYIGDRRAEYASVDISLSYMSFWIFVLFAMVFFGGSKKFKEERVFETCFSITIITLFVGLGMLKLPSIRFISIGYPLIISSILMLADFPRALLLFAFVFYTLVQWIYWVGL